MRPATLTAPAIGTVGADDDVAVLRRRRSARRRRHVACWVTLLLLLTVMFLLSLSVDDVPVSVPDVIRTLMGNGSEYTDYLVLESRFPRAVCAVAVGLCLGMSGAIFQSIAGNPLATPDIIGITSGSSAAAVFGIVAFGLSGAGLSAMATGGGLLAAGSIYLFAWRGGLPGYRLVLVGIALSAAFYSVVSWTLTYTPFLTAQKALIWITGSLNEAVAETAWRAVVAAAVLVPAGLLLAARLDTLRLGDDLARGLGQRVEAVRAAIVVVAVLLASSATGIGGPIAFVAFLAAPIARRLVGTGSLALVSSALVGAVLVVGADMAGEQAFGSVRLPVGVVTGVIGAPYLIWLLVSANRAGRAA